SEWQRSGDQMRPESRARPVQRAQVIVHNPKRIEVDEVGVSLADEFTQLCQTITPHLQQAATSSVSRHCLDVPGAERRLRANGVGIDVSTLCE
ncbi:MAG: hypothetical protein ACUVX8_19300, partial [Candidatus Zipacnadales bacterium]